MIELSVYDFCHACEFFEPEAKRTVLWSNGEPVIIETVVTCRDRKKCEALLKRTRNQECRASGTAQE